MGKIPISVHFIPKADTFRLESGFETLAFESGNQTNLMESFLPIFEG